MLKLYEFNNIFPRRKWLRKTKNDYEVLHLNSTKNAIVLKLEFSNFWNVMCSINLYM